MSLHREKEYLIFPYRLLTTESLVDGVSSLSWIEVDDMGCLEASDNISKTWEGQWQYFRRWSPLQILQGNLGLWGVFMGKSRLSSQWGVVEWDLISFFFFLFLNIPFLILLIHLITSFTNFNRRRRRKGIIHTSEEGERSTWY